MGKTLVFAVYDFDRFNKDDEIGEVTASLIHVYFILYNVMDKDLEKTKIISGKESLQPVL